MVTVSKYVYVPPTPTEQRKRLGNVLLAFNLGFVAYSAWAVIAQVFFSRPVDWFLEGVMFLILAGVDYSFAESGKDRTTA